MRERRPYFKQKPILYCDENVPRAVVDHFKRSFWKKKVKIISAGDVDNYSRSDRFHYIFCRQNKYTLVTLDRDFNYDRLYPFTTGHMYGIIIISVSKSDPVRVTDVLARILAFVTGLPFPKAFLMETKFVAGRDGVIIRGRHSVTHRVVALQVTAGVTTIREIRQFFAF